MSAERVDALACDDSAGAEIIAADSDDADQTNINLGGDLDCEKESESDGRLIVQTADVADLLSQPLDTDRYAKEWNEFDRVKKKSYWPLVLDW